MKHEKIENVKRRYPALKEREITEIAQNLAAFEYNFGAPRIERADYGNGFYVYLNGEESYIQFCHNLAYLDGWLYGVVQGVNRAHLARISSARKENGTADAEQWTLDEARP